MGSLKNKEHPKLVLTNPFSTFGPAFGFIFRVMSEFWAVYLFSSKRDFVWAVILIITLLLTGFQIGLHWPWQVLVEAKRSWDRGLRTETYLHLTRADVGVH